MAAYREPNKPNYRPMEATPMPRDYEPMRPMPPRSYGDDMISIAYEPEPMGPIGGPRGPIPSMPSKEDVLRYDASGFLRQMEREGGNRGPMGPMGPIMDEMPRRPQMPGQGSDEDRSGMMKKIMEMFRSRENSEQRPQRRGPSRKDRMQSSGMPYQPPRMRPRMPDYNNPSDIFDRIRAEKEMISYRPNEEMMQRQPRPPMMMSDGGSAWRGSLPQGYEADEELRAQALADVNAGADINGDNLISDEELYNWRPSDARYGTNPNNRVNRDQAYSQAALDTLRRQGAEMGDDGVFSEDEFWKFDAARQQNEGQNYGGATLKGEFNYQDPSTWNAPQPPMPERMPMPPSQTTYVPEPARNPYVFGGYGSPPPQYAGMADPRMTNIVGMAPPSYYGGAEE